MNQQHPPKTTLILHNVPDKCLLGIDLQFFTSTLDFNGIKVIPAGVHVLHWSPPTPSAATSGILPARRIRRLPDDEQEEAAVADQTPADDDGVPLNSKFAPGETVMSNMNLRMAKFFEAKEGRVIQMAWKDEVEEFVESDQDLSGRDLIDLYSHLLPYPDSTPPYSDLTSLLTPELLSTFLPLSYVESNVPISSITASSADSILLNQAIAKASSTSSSSSSSKRASSTDEDRESFRFLAFDLKRQRTWPEGATGRQITAAALDRSWFLNDLISRERDGNYNAIVAELQLCFLLLVLLANYAAAEQWKRLLDLLCSSQSALYTHASLYLSLLATLEAQFQCVPEVYFTDLLGAQFVRRQLRALRKSIADPDSYPPPSLPSSTRSTLLTHLSQISSTLSDKFALDIESSHTRASARKRRQKESTLAALSGGYSSASFANGFESVHHYGSDSEDYDDDGEGEDAMGKIGAEYDSDDVDEERGEFAPVVVEL
ncbi:A1 cistron-splicing factor [Myxozyma melibiosi]|uniref:A1 cistron-splicing factor n=1 Tax=Myxozyma melibiosi TaxID=54550 RepID=A0ABR1F1T3_9ASCO